MISLESVTAENIRDLGRKLRQRGLAICVVYERDPPLDLLGQIQLQDGEYFVGLNLLDQSPAGRSALEEAGTFECMWRKWPEGSKFPLPYLFTFVPGVGPFANAISSEEVPEMLVSSRKEAKEVGHAREVGLKAYLLQKKMDAGSDTANE